MSVIVQVVSVSSAEDVLLTWEEDRSQRSLGELARNSRQFLIQYHLYNVCYGVKVKISSIVPV